MPPIAHLHLKLWLDHNGEELLGAGRAELLRRIGEMGSLKKAAESMNMSYRAAWGRLKRTEAALGVELIVNAEARRDGCQLSPTGRKLMEAFLRWHEDVHRYALERAASLPLKVVAAEQEVVRKELIHPI